MEPFRWRRALLLGLISSAASLAGLVVDLRDVPLKLPDRADLRGELLDAWQSVLVTGRDA